MPISLSGSLSLTGSLTVSGSMIYSGSVVSTQPMTASAFLTTGTITAQTLVVSTISSSLEYASGSNIFGNNLTNTQTMTGSLNLTGSATVVGNLTLSSGGDRIISVNDTGGNLFQIQAASNALYYSARTTGGSLIFRTNGTNDSKLTIGSDGNATFSGSVTAGGDITIPNGNYYYAKRNTGGSAIGVMGFAAGSDTLTIKGGTSGAAVAMQFQDTGGTVMSLYNSCVGIGTPSPAYPLTLAASSANFAFYNTFNNAAMRNWAICQSYVNLGDMSFMQSNAQNGDPIAAGTVRMHLNYNGNVGINTTIPTTKLSVNSGISVSSTNAISIMQNTDGNNKDAAAFGVAINNGGQNTNAADLFIMTATGGSLVERMRITSGGNVGIGVSPFANTLSKSLDLVNGGGLFAASNNFYVVGNAYYNSQWLYKATSGAAAINLNAGGDGSIAFVNAGSGTVDTTVGFTEKMRITSGGQIGIGTGSVDPAVSIDIQNLSAVSNNVFLRLKNNAISEDCGFIVSGSTGGTAYEHRFGVNTIAATSDFIFHNSNSLGYRWYVDGTQRLIVNSSGVKFQNGASSLNYYEEGTFTPTLSFGGGSAGITYSTQSGYYIRIGNYVYFSLRFIITSKGSSTGGAAAGGLPFTSGAGSGNFGAITCAFADAMASFNKTLIFIVDPSSTSVNLRYNDGVNWQPLTDSNFTNSSNIIIGGSYRTS